MHRKFYKAVLLLLFLCYPLIKFPECFAQNTDLPLYYWRQKTFTNFGDYLSLKVVERMVDGPVRIYWKNPHVPEKKLLAIGSIMTFAIDGDVIWGAGVNGKRLAKTDYLFTHLDIRAVRGPLTRKFLMEKFHIKCPEIYGDPALLIPYLFPEFKKSKKPIYDYLVIPHYSDMGEFPQSEYPNIIYPTQPWNEVVEKILQSKFVISSSLHGIIVAEAFGIPARLLRVGETEPLFKYQDYYLGTNRPYFQYATSVEEALKMGGEPPFDCDLKKLYEAFPFEFWPNTPIKSITQRNL